MLITFFGIHLHIAVSLGVVGGLLLLSVIASLLFPKKEDGIDGGAGERRGEEPGGAAGVGGASE
jgi:tellurite resistance protein TerC